MPQKLAGYARTTELNTQIEEVLRDNAVLEENYAAAAAAILQMRVDEEGWLPITRVSDTDGFSLKSIQDIAEFAELQTTGNPLLKRGLGLRTEYVFGKGIKFDGAVAPRFREIADKAINHSVLFSEEAFAENSRALFTSGNLLMAYRISTKTFFPIPFQQVSNSASNPDLAQDVWYYQRTYSPVDLATNQPSPEPVQVWYPVLEKFEAGKSKLRKTIAGDKVDSDVVVIDMKVNKAIGQVWGVPDCLPAMPYAWAHAEYLRDGSKLLKALATIAWKVVSRTKQNAVNAGAKMAGDKRAGSTATMTDGTDLVAMPRAGQVDLKDGQQLAAYVASALSVSLVALLSDPGAASGSYGAAASLDGPSANSARSRQALWVDFYKRVYRAMGVKAITPNFPKISEDPIFRQAQTIGLGRSFGLVYQDEARQAFLELTDIPSLHQTPPPVEEYAPVAPAANSFLNASVEQTTTTGDPNSRQGNSTPVGALDDGENVNRNADAVPGTSA